jgi:hypothetical protein
MKTKPIQTIFKTFIITITFSFLAAESKGGSFVYDVVSITLTDLFTGDEYLVSGTITTGCNNCVLTENDIIEYDVAVTGTLPFNFDPFNPNATARMQNVHASPTEIFIASPGSSFDRQVFESFDDSDPGCNLPNCADFAQKIIWGTANQTGISVAYDFRDSNLSQMASASFFDDTMPGDVVIAVRVPGPTSIRLLLIGLVIALTCRRL